MGFTAKMIVCLYLGIISMIPQNWMEKTPMFAVSAFKQSESRFLKFTYGDNDALGPRHWVDLEDGLDTTIACDDIWRTPLNVNTSLAAAHERIKFEEEGVEEDDDMTMTFNFNINIENREWPLGYPEDSFHGIVVRAPNAGTFQLLDRFDPILGNDDTLYDFAFASIHYCDLSAHPTRSMHQVNGERYPFEFDMFFFKHTLNFGVDTSLMEDNIGVLVAVLGVIGSNDNARIEPLIKAAKRLHLPKEFDLDEIDFDDRVTITEDIPPPWSPTWLIPDVSTYYYYNDGSFPVPPCYTIHRVYVIKEPIMISLRQWSVLTNISSERELNHKLECTFSVLQDEVDDVRYNSHEYVFRGKDGRPMTASERKIVKNREEKDEMDRIRQDLLRKGLKQCGVNVQSSSFLIALSLTCLFVCFLS